MVAPMPFTASQLASPTGRSFSASIEWKERLTFYMDFLRGVFNLLSSHVRSLGEPPSLSLQMEVGCGPDR